MSDDRPRETAAGMPKGVIHLSPTGGSNEEATQTWRAERIASDGPGTMMLAGLLVAACRSIHDGAAEQLRLEPMEGLWRLTDGHEIRMERVPGCGTGRTIANERIELIDPDGRILIASGMPSKRTPDGPIGGRIALRDALHCQAAVRAIVDGATLPWSDPLVEDGLREAFARAVEDHESTDAAEGTLRTACPGIPGTSSVLHDGSDVTSLEDEDMGLPWMPIVLMRGDDHPIVVMRPAWVMVEDCQSKRSPIDRLRGSARLAELLSRRVAVEEVADHPITDLEEAA
jgi:hypothetical protein